MSQRTLHCEAALLPGGLARDVRLTIADGWITVVEPGAVAEGERVAGLVLPGLPNLHSHAFQRGMAGLCERRGQGDDSFWTWREVMYRFLDRLEPEDVEAIAAQAFVEMLEGGFTALAEFHYLHHGRDGAPYASRAAMAQAIAAAADETGLGLTLLPVLYRFGGFGEAAPSPGQRRFLNDRDGYLRLLDDSAAAIAHLPDARLGVAPHSMRAVATGDLAWVAGLRPDAPVHIHVAEQVREVEDCLKATGRRSVELLMEHVALAPRWCLIHATHLTSAERDGIARSGAVAGLCPVTEANLGDGIYDGIAFREAGGRYGVGSDSNVLIDAGAELRQLEYSQRLRDRGRTMLADRGCSNGVALWREAAAGGARACGRAIGAIEPGRRADLVALDGAAPALAGATDEALLDAAIFAAVRFPVDRAWVGGIERVSGGGHHRREAIASRYGAVMKRLRDAL